MSGWAVKCKQCGIIERGSREECNRTLESHDQFHSTSLLRPATDGGEEIATDGGERLTCPQCSHPLDTEANNDALADDPDHEYFCPSCGHLFEDDTAIVDNGVDTPVLCKWPYDATVFGAELNRDCLALTGTGKPCSYNAYPNNALPVCNTHADVDDPDIPDGAHQWARIDDADETVTVCVNCEVVWYGKEPEIAVGCPECEADAGERCRDETSTYSAPIPPHPQRRGVAYSLVDGFEPCPATHDTDHKTLATDGGRPAGQNSGAAATPTEFKPYGAGTVRQLAGVGDQDPTCEHGVEGCPGPGGGLDQCFDCFLEGGGQV